MYMYKNKVEQSAFFQALMSLVHTLSGRHGLALGLV